MLLLSRVPDMIARVFDTDVKCNVCGYVSPLLDQKFFTGEDGLESIL